jgi:hypothetical protein
MQERKGRFFLMYLQSQLHCWRHIVTIASATCRISHLGVDVAPHTPALDTPLNHPGLISSAEETKKVRLFSLRQTSNSIRPLELFFPLTKMMTSCCLTNIFSLGSRSETCLQVVLWTFRMLPGCSYLWLASRVYFLYGI